MPSPMEGSSREGDLFTVKHELKNGKFTCNPVKLLRQSILFAIYLSFSETRVRGRDVSWLAWTSQLSLSNGSERINVTPVQKWQRKANVIAS